MASLDQAASGTGNGTGTTRANRLVYRDNNRSDRYPSGAAGAFMGRRGLLVDSLPWHLFPHVDGLPTIDHTLSPSKTTTTTFVDVDTKLRIDSILSDWYMSLCAQEELEIRHPSRRILAMSRICAILHLINRHDLLPCFLENEITDAQLCLDLESLGKFLDDRSTIEAFHKAQYRARVRDFKADWCDFAQHELVPLRTIRPLGHGGFARVDCVEHVLKGHELAHKVFTLRRKQEKRIEDSFRAEIQILKRFSGHQHIIEYIGAYRSPNCLGLLLRPVAECDLYQYLSNPNRYDFDDRDMILGHAFGCLTSALAFMHSHQVRHKDVKASNVLLKAAPSGTMLMFTDFGIALDFSDVANSMSNGPKPQRTLRYCAPEVAHARKRGRRSDVFSLGCLFLEVVTVLAGHSLDDLEDTLDEDGNFHENEQQLLSWLRKLGEEETEFTQLPLRWILPMMHRRPDERPHAQDIVDAMANDTKSRRELRNRTFCDLCIDELKIQKKITLTETGYETAGSDSDYDTDNDQDENHAQSPHPKRFYTDDEDDVIPPPIDVAESSAFGQDRTYIDITAIPRLQLGQQHRLIYTYVSFAQCLRVYNTFGDCSELWASRIYLRRRVDFEMLRLLNWSFVIGLSRGGPLQPSEFEAASYQKTILNNVLQQQAIIEQCASYYPEQITADPVATGSGRRLPAIATLLLNSVISSVIGTPLQSEIKKTALSQEPKAANNTDLEKTIAALELKNDQLRNMLDHSSTKILREKDEETNLELLQLCETPEDLLDLVRGVCPIGLPSTKPEFDVRSSDKFWPLTSALHSMTDDAADGLSTRISIARFARFKAINTAVNTRNVGPPTDMLNLSRNDISLTHEDHDGYEIDAKVPGSWNLQPGRARPIWVEWKEYEPSIFAYPGPDPIIVERIQALVALLNDGNKPKALSVPRCRGYFNDIDLETGEDNCRFGLVFEVPDHVRTGGGSLEPISLLELLRSGGLNARSLSTRMELALKLAETLQRLHAVNWLHKGLRSSNVLFFEDAEGTPNLANPILSGFDYSRPAMNDDMTEKPPESAGTDIYRHPNVQGSGNRDSYAYGYKSTYDIYSLGIVLIEIAFWQPIDKVVGIRDLSNARPSVIFLVRKRLLDEESKVFEQMRFIVGDDYTETLKEVVKACLQGPVAFGLDEGADERKVSNIATLQAGFYRKVVRRLRRLREQI